MDHPIKVLVSSTVRGQERLLERVYELLRHYNYSVWMSHSGTLPVYHGLSAFESCLKAVEDCDVLLGIISGYYGSGRTGPGTPSIFHQEVSRAIEIDKPRFFVAHHNVVLARELFKGFRRNADGTPNTDGRTELAARFRSSPVLSDLALLDLYEEVIQDHVPLEDRKTNWAQEYRTDQDVIAFVEAQFSDTDRIRAMLPPPIPPAP